jgi:AhpD family alkylhydroperoxidase
MDTVTPDTVDILTRLDIDTAAPAFSRALAALDAAATTELDRAGVAQGLRELVRLRASLLNGCAYCVDLHTRAAIEAGEPLGRVTAVGVWRESPFFTARERSALALTDAMTRAVDTHVPDGDWADAAAHLGTDELAALVSLVVVINAWNTVGVTTRAWTPTL